MKKLIFSLYALLCYLIFFGTFVYMIGFVENIVRFDFADQFANLFPKTLDTGRAAVSLPLAITIDLLLIALFGLQHSVMARQGFKQKWTKVVSRAIERSTYVLMASVLLIILFYFWQPVKMILWDFRQTNAGMVLFGVSLLGWTLLLISTFLINHFDLFGLRQVYIYLKNKKSGHIEFRTPGFYKYVRHPIYFSFLIIFWFAPVMTLGHLLFASGFTMYILIGIYHEEKDLVQLFGKNYLNYRERVPKLLPFIKHKTGSKSSSPAWEETN